MRVASSYGFANASAASQAKAVLVGVAHVAVLAGLAVGGSSKS